MELQTYVFNIGLNKGKSNEQIKRDDLWRAMVSLAQGGSSDLVTRIHVDVPQGKKYVKRFGVRIYEPTDIYLVKSYFIPSAQVGTLCTQFEQDAIPYAIYDECYRPVHAHLVYSNECIKEARYDWGTFNPQYFATPIKGDLTNL